MTSELTPVSGSFRDPKGSVARNASGDVFRLISEAGRSDFEDLEASGLFAELISRRKLIDHTVLRPSQEGRPDEAEIVLQHPRLPMVSYPYEWCFQQMKDAALLQLELYLDSLEFGKTLSNATAYNIQFVQAKPIFIDTLSFTPYVPGQFWAGQEQFTEQFLNPLLLTASSGLPFNDTYRGALTGIPSDMISAVLPFRRKLSWRYINYIHLPRRSQKRLRASNGAHNPKVTGTLPKEGFQFILKQLRAWVRSLAPSAATSNWSEYTQTRTYGDQSVSQKRQFIAECVAATRPSQVLDIGCNTGEFSFLALEAGAGHVVGLEGDHQALSTAYDRASSVGASFLPIYQDLTNPSPSQGWANEEREPLSQRVSADFLLALAILHHIVISGNVPLERALSYVLGLAPTGVIEWVPKSDPMVQTLLRNRADIFETYHQVAFESALTALGVVVQKQMRLDNGRRLYFYERVLRDRA